MYNSFKHYKKLIKKQQDKFSYGKFKVYEIGNQKILARYVGNQFKKIDLIVIGYISENKENSLVTLGSNKNFIPHKEDGACYFGEKISYYFVNRKILNEKETEPVKRKEYFKNSVEGL